MSVRLELINVAFPLEVGGLWSLSSLYIDALLLVNEKLAWLSRQKAKIYGEGGTEKFSS